ncbi:MAG TPA: STAS domain-containing protein [Dyella sp.]|uniref:STAS domain-containing protein n=1 Tax=Dyella sp. TaxID=1869338 RepID=UPI002F928DD8
MRATGFQVAQSAPDTVSVSGALTFATAADALTSIRAALPGRQVLDLAGVEHSDSAGLACVLAVLAPNEGKVRVRNLPPNMRKLAQVCEVEALLG